MFRTVFIQESLPRDVTSFNSSFMEGLGMSRWLGLFLLAGGIILFLIAAIKFKMIIPSILFLIIAVVGLMAVRKADNRASERKNIFLNGEIVYASVIDHGRKFDIFKLSNEYTITVKSSNSTENLVISNSDDGLLKSAPIGEEILGLHHDGKYFFGQEMGVQFKLYSK